MKTTLVAAAISGMVVGAGGIAAAHPLHSGAAVRGDDGSGAQQLDDKGADKDKGHKGGDKHSCKGKNDCKGKGGCKTDKHACKGQNACKGQGGCNA